MREGIEERVRRDVVDLSRGTGDRAARREERRRSRARGRRPQRRADKVPSTFGASTRSAVARSLVAMSPSSSAPAACTTPWIEPKRATVVLTISAIRARSVTSPRATITSAPSASRPRTWAMRAADAVILTATRDPAIPLLTFRECGAADQHQPRLRGPREVFGDGEADPAQAAGDEIDAAVAHAARPRVRVDGNWLEGLHPAIRAAERDHLIGDRRGDLGDELLNASAAPATSRTAAGRRRRPARGR